MPGFPEAVWSTRGDGVPSDISHFHSATILAMSDKSSMLGWWYLASGGMSSSSSLLSLLNTADTGLDAFFAGGPLFPMEILMPKFFVLFSGSGL